MEDKWIVIPHWDRFQHYKNRNPVWIKVYPELLSDEAYLGLTFHQRGVLHSLWMEYARAQRQLPGSTLTLTRRLGDRVTTATLEALNHAGFIQIVASKPLAQIREEKNIKSLTVKEEQELWKTQLPKILKDLQ